jgi:hypothetical protein
MKRVEDEMLRVGISVQIHCMATLASHVPQGRGRKHKVLSSASLP